MRLPVIPMQHVDLTAPPGLTCSHVAFQACSQQAGCSQAEAEEAAGTAEAAGEQGLTPACRKLYNSIPCRQHWSVWQGFVRQDPDRCLEQLILIR